MKSIFDSIITFLLGFLSCVAIFISISLSGNEIPLGLGISNPSPSNWISEEDIILLKDKIIININNAELSYYSPTGSMRPTLDEGANGIRITPTNSDDINIGDIISFNRDGILIVHRVIGKGYDENGLYFITKGDNNNFSDGKVRFSDIKYITIGILY